MVESFLKTEQKIPFLEEQKWQGIPGNFFLNTNVMAKKKCENIGGKQSQTDANLQLNSNWS